MLAAAAYTFAPYHFVDIYVRTNLGEFFAWTFPPFIIYTVLEWDGRDKLKLLPGVAGFALMALNHLLSCLIMVVAYSLFVLFYVLFSPRQSRFRTLSGAVVSAVCGLGLSAFFWLPAVVDLKLVKGEATLTSNYNHYTNHFVEWWQLLSNYWDYGASNPGPDDTMSFSVGLILAIMAASSFVLLLFSILKRPALLPPDTAPFEERAKLNALTGGAFFTALFMVFMTTSLSARVWDLITPLQTAQFPWRFLFPVTFFIALAIGALPSLVQEYFQLKSRPILLSIVLTLIIISSNWHCSRAGHFDFIRQPDLSVDAVEQKNIYTTNDSDFMPKEVSFIPSPWSERKAADFFDNGWYRADYRIDEIEKGWGWARIKISSGGSGVLTFNQHWHKPWTATIDGRPSATFPFLLHPYAPIGVPLPPGAHEVALTFGLTTAGKAGIFGSLLSLSLLCLAPILKRVTKPRAILLGSLIAPLISAFATWLILYISQVPLFSLAKGELALQIGKEDENRCRQTVALERLSHVKPEKTAWDDPSNVKLHINGLLVDLGKTAHAKSLEISVDNNDFYAVAYLKRGELVGTSLVDPVYSVGLSIKRLEPSAQTVAAGYDTLLIYPVHGDGMYALGHLVLSEDGG